MRGVGPQRIVRGQGAELYYTPDHYQSFIPLKLMTLTTTPFRFDESDLPPSPALVAQVPPAISSTAALLEELSQRLRFPEYFGGNWDALWECIRDPVNKFNVLTDAPSGRVITVF